MPFCDKDGSTTLSGRTRPSASRQTLDQSINCAPDFCDIKNQNLPEYEPLAPRAKAIASIRREANPFQQTP
jgi:hypothetical protein